MVLKENNIMNLYLCLVTFGFWVIVKCSVVKDPTYLLIMMMFHLRLLMSLGLLLISCKILLWNSF